MFPAATEAADLKSVLDTAWDKDLRFLTNQDTDVNPKVDQWNNGTDAAAELRRIMNVRRAGMERFGETAIQKDWPMAMIEDVLVPLYLHHRYAVEAAASAIGGQDYIYAMRGDGRQPVAWVSAAAQKAALDALMETLKPSELALSRSVLSKIPPRPDGYDRTRELFPRNTGGAFDPLSPAVVASDLTVGFILTNARAARMVSQHAVDATLPGLDDVVDRIVTTTFDGAASSSVHVGNQAVGRAGRGEPPDRSRRDGADVAGARDRHAEAQGDPGTRDAADTRRCRPGDAAAHRQRHRSVSQAARRARAPRDASRHAAGRADWRAAVQLSERRGGLQLHAICDSRLMIDD